MNKQDERKPRLAQALRDNLRRRKAQARESAESSTARPTDIPHNPTTTAPPESAAAPDP